jgi:flagellar hook-associated protein 3 FlgL
MRVTNNMITSNTKTNINANKVLVDKYNTQMTTQKKINKPSDDPVVAIRSLRMQTTLSHLDQYLDNNIEDANAWLEVTDTALENMVGILTDIRTQCVNGSTDTLTQDDRKTILNQLQQMSDQIYCEGNADYAGRTVFTGYRTSSQLTFSDDEQDTTYTIDQSFSYQDLKDQRYYYGEAEVPADANTECTTDIGTHTYSRIRLAYDGIDSLDQISYTSGSDTTTFTMIDASDVDEDTDLTGKVVVYDSEADWYAATQTADDAKTLGDNDVIFIKESGELIFGQEIAHTLAQGKADISVSYTKTGFDSGEARPEYYYDCTMKTPDMDEALSYTKQNQQINFVISTGVTLPANTQASEVLDTSIGRDVNELIDVVNSAINAHDKVDQITEMMTREQFADEDSQAVLQGYLDAAQKEADYADDNLKKTYKQYITNFDNYLQKVNNARTNVGSLENRLSLTQTRVENQKATVEELKSNNDNRDISDIIIDYYAAYNAYTSSLTAAAKVGQQTLLNYL